MPSDDATVLLVKYIMAINWDFKGVNELGLDAIKNEILSFFKIFIHFHQTENKNCERIRFANG